VLSIGVAETFFFTTNGIIDKSSEYTKTNGPASLNGQDCYVLIGDVNNQTLLVWVNKKSFLLSQVEVILGGKVDEAELKKLPFAQRNAAMLMAKMKGSVTETYDNIQTNQQLLASAFSTPLKPAANPGAAPRRPSSRGIGEMANPGRRSRPQ
jgi:hypothetical protein